MTIEERDKYTGYLTTGHEWNGIKELNTPVPRAVYFFLLITFLFSLVYWVLMPAWPLGVSYTAGFLGIDQRGVVQDSLRIAATDRSEWTKQVDDKSYREIQANPMLMSAARQTGRTLFGDNCSVCHGLDAKGGRGFPNLTTNSWLWGGDPETIAETIRVGINGPHLDSRSAQMPAFGRDQILDRADIDKVVAFVRSLSGLSTENAGDLNAGKEIFAANCAACHGDDAKGNSDAGAPDLTDKYWIYGGDMQTITNTVRNGRQGVMPSWESRLSPLERKILALYLVDERGAGQ